MTVSTRGELGGHPGQALALQVKQVRWRPSLGNPWEGRGLAVKWQGLNKGKWAAKGRYQGVWEKLGWTEFGGREEERIHNGFQISNWHLGAGSWYCGGTVTR